jgi:phosphoribosylformylglycinamidine synthase
VSNVACIAQVVKAPGNLVISAYVTCPDITLTVTPDLKLPGTGKLLWVDLGGGRKRLGGSALAHAYGQVRFGFHIAGHACIAVHRLC